MATLAKAVLLAIGCCMVSLPAMAQEKSIDGSWEGTLKQATSEQKLFISFGAQGGRITGTVGFPASGILEWPFHTVRFDSPAFQVEIKTDDGIISAKGIVRGDVLSGDLILGPSQIPFSLRRVKRPPKPYKEEEVRFKNGTVTLAGTLFVPKSAGKLPALIVVGGGGPSTRNDGRFSADLFARRGLIVLIYDKRGAGASTGDWRTSSVEDLATDLLAGVQLLEMRPDVDSKRLGFLGRSEGSWIVGMAASRRPESAFVIMESGGGVATWQQQLYLQEMILRNNGFEDNDVAEALRITRLGLDFARTGQGWDHLATVLEAARDKKWFPLLRTRMPRTHWFWKFLSLFTYDPGPALNQIKCPVLGIFGELDYSTPVKPTVKRMEEFLKMAGNRDVTIRIFPRASHGLTVKEGAIDVLVAGYWDTLTDWLLSRIKRGNVTGGRNHGA
jgi:pimeloyl-ACP methyl ester carboxylesterase